jgi:hypothetical protein
VSEWVSIPGFPKYSVDPLGQVRKESTGRLVRSHMNQTGSVYVSLMRENWELCSRSLARIVAHVFLEPPTENFDTPINLDGDRWNCAADNLMWRPRWFAIQYHQQFEIPFRGRMYGPLRDLKSQEVSQGSLAVACRYGLLERDVVLSIMNRTYVWPTYQMFGVAL